MIRNIAIAPVFVSNVERSVSWFRDKLGFEVLSDSPFPGGGRWVELAPPGAQTRIVPYSPGQMPPEVRKLWEPLVGTFSPLTFACDDVEATHRELSARGVEFSKPPTREPWGAISAELRDPDGNRFFLTGP